MNIGFYTTGTMTVFISICRINWKSYILLDQKLVSSERRQQMRTVDEYMKLPYRMEIVPDTEEGGYAVSFPDLPGCLTMGDTIEEAIKNAEDAKRSWIEAAIEDGFSISEPDDLENYSGQFKLRIPKSLHKSLSEHSKAEGISMNQYCLYLLTKNDSAYVG